jgi:hypothetical protein
MTPEQLEAIKKAIREQQSLYATAQNKAVAAYLAGDHWQKGAGWSGPRPSATGDEMAAGVVSTVLAEIERGFVSQNLIAECVSRHVDAVMVEPNISSASTRELGVVDGKPEQPNQSEAALIQAASSAITAWMDSKKLLAVVEKAVAQAVATGRGVLRLYIPRASVQTGDDGTATIRQGELNEVITQIWVNAPDASMSGVLTDADGVQIGAYLEYLDAEKIMRLETQSIENGQTMLRVETKEGFAEAAYPLGGALLTYELTRKPLVTAQIVSLQKLINKIHTMLSRNTDVGGFIERVIENGQLPTIEKIGTNGEIQKIPVPLKVGAGTVNFIAPYEYEDELGKKQVIPARVNFRDPVPVNTFVESLASTENAVYKEFKQLHVLMGGSAAVSGRSRVQAMNDYRLSVKPTVAMLEGAYRWLFSTVLRLAAHFEGNAERFASLRPVVTLTPEITLPDAEDIRVLLEMHNGGLLSRESAMLQSQKVKDPAAELEMLQTEAVRDRGIGDPNALRDSLTRAVEANAISAVEALIQQGYSKEDAERIVAARAAELAELESGV